MIFAMRTIAVGMGQIMLQLKSPIHKIAEQSTQELVRFEDELQMSVTGSQFLRTTCEIEPTDEGVQVRFDLEAHSCQPFVVDETGSD